MKIIRPNKSRFFSCFRELHAYLVKAFKEKSSESHLIVDSKSSGSLILSWHTNSFAEADLYKWNSDKFVDVKVSTAIFNLNLHFL